MKDRYKILLEALEVERKHEENYYAILSGHKSTQEKIESGILLTHLSLECSSFIIGENIELKFSRPEYDKSPHRLKVGMKCNLVLEREETISLKATISYKRHNQISVILDGFNFNLKDFPTNIHYKLEMVYDERPYRIMRNVLETVINSKEPRIVAFREGIRLDSNFGDKKDNDHSHLDSHEYLNQSQQDAINKMIESSQIGIIHGPPGTGKTTTLVQLVKLVLRTEKKVLVCGPSNSCVDLMAKKLDEQKLKVLRVGNVTRIEDDILDLTLDYKARKHPDWSHIKKVKIDAREARRKARQYKRKFGKQERENRNIFYKESRELSKWARDLEIRMINNIISDSQVICCTLIGISSDYINDLKFDTVIIDEASQALEPECWNAMIRADRVIFAGDHMQLPPTVKSKKAVEMGLSITLLDLLTDKIKYKNQLNIQYRMNDTIMGFSNEQFYNRTLISADDVKSTKLHPESSPIIFIDTSGCGFDESINPQTNSLKNEGEYFVLRELVLSELDLYKQNTIGIISPYAEQVKFLHQEIIKEDEFSKLNITVNTIDGFQGQERDIIIISLVRSNIDGILGFVKDKRRLNVALTRAKKQLVIIGDSATLGNSKLYADLMDYVESHGQYKSAWEYMN